ncbi:uncharacterized protein LOC141714414 [Apium graveolens]|uniref:uncharacterized protein LOC141714414 n=1 Tax=Apium graveolens TaxID=4045 RepID=UPI003D7B3DE9
MKVLRNLDRVTMRLSEISGAVQIWTTHPKWRKPATSASSKRTKLSSSGAYSLEGNNDTPTSDDCEPVRPKGTKTAKRKGKRKATAAKVEEYKALQVSDLRRMNIMETVNEIHQKDIETRQRELEAKQAEMDLQVILVDTTKMNDTQRKIHAKLLEKIMASN